jgi:RHS repeat-associated protein
VNTFDPKRKFSDKERDGETGLDYFGARYYSAPVRRADGHSSGNYRWLSADPMLIKRNDPNPPVHWNLYTFCQNNPISYKDDVGREVATDKTIHIFLGVELGPQYLDYAKLEELRLKGYKIIIHEVGTWTADDFKASLKGENSWTFYIGHSEGRGENYNGIFIPGQAGLFAGQGLNYTNNERVGIFGCNSANYANDLVYGSGTTIFSLASKGNAKVAGYWTGAYYLIYELAKGASLEDAARRFQEELEGILKPKGWYRGEKLKIR